jgi:hypothetical protein
MDKRKDVWHFVGNVFEDVTKYLKKYECIDDHKLESIVVDDEPCSEIHFASPDKALIDDKNFYLIPHNDGFLLYYKGINKEDKPDFYHDAYDNPWIDSKIAGVFENLYEKDVFKILQLPDGDIQKKLDVCMRIFDNKQRLENVYPISKITV